MGYVIFTRTLRQAKYNGAARFQTYRSCEGLMDNRGGQMIFRRWRPGIHGWAVLYSLANTYAYMASLGILCIQSEFAECPRQLGSLSIYSIKRA
jgi:hypothetical protein